jgi:hypothetical protein
MWRNEKKWLLLALVVSDADLGLAEVRLRAMVPKKTCLIFWN